jgi:hypothetical protein
MAKFNMRRETVSQSFICNKLPGRIYLQRWAAAEEGIALIEKSARAMTAAYPKLKLMRLICLLRLEAYTTISPEIRSRFARAAIDCRTGERRFLSLVHDCDAEGVFQEAARERGIFRIWKEEMDERFDRSGSERHVFTLSFARTGL